MSALSVMDSCVSALRGQCCGEGELSGDLEDARAAVAELVAVADSIKARVEKGIKAAGGRYQFMTPEAATQFDRLCAALARCGGAS